MFITMTETVFTLERRGYNESRPFFILVHFPMWGGRDEERWELRHRRDGEDVTIAAWGGEPDHGEIHAIADEWLESEGISPATYPHGEQRMCGPDCGSRLAGYLHDDCPEKGRY